MITKEQYEILEKYKVNLLWAVKSNCVGAMMRSELDELEDIYVSLGNNKLTTRSCGHCVLKMMQVLGKEYYDYEQQRKQENSGSGDGDVEQAGTTNTEKQDINSSKKDNTTRRSGKRTKC